MIAYIRNSSFGKVYVIDAPISVIWERNFYEPSFYQMQVAATKELFQLLQSSADLFLTSDIDSEAMMIETVRLTTSQESGDTITISGRSAIAILERRVIRQQRTFTNVPPEQIAFTLFTSNFKSDTAFPDRNVSIINMNSSGGTSAAISTQFTGQTVLEAIQSLAATVSKGLAISLTGNGASLVWRFLVGQNRPAVIFSEDFETLTGSDYTFSTQNFATMAFVGGEGEGTARIVSQYIRNFHARGLSRREIWVDARDVSSNNGEIDSSAYVDLLSQRARQKLTEHEIMRSFEGTLPDTSPYIYGTDYTLGDTVYVQNRYSVKASAQVVSFTTVMDGSGVKRYPRLDNFNLS